MKVKIKLRRSRKAEGKYQINLTRDSLLPPTPLPLRRLCRKFMKVFINNREISLTRATVAALGKKSKADSCKIQINVTCVCIRVGQSHNTRGRSVEGHRNHRRQLRLLQIQRIPRFPALHQPMQGGDECGVGEWRIAEAV
eukprot:TRINITY_DN6023_c0_g1_i1.p3 TRINITY_DN6023_c0_g1~~TRINITY_DN6023_c0_g1_i1.p3  ORF type:complete len:140 (-),score=10.04 TRINITY_DN6023_c0_g1_i1:240-659(-)